MNQPIVIQQPEPRVTRDPILSEPRYRMKVRVNVHSTSVYQANVINHLLMRGEHEIVAYESQVPSILAKVETKPEEIERAKEIVRRKRREAMVEAMQSRGDQFGWQEIDPLEYDSVRHSELRRIFRHDSFKANDVTVEGEFYRAVGRSILPLTMATQGERLEPLRSDDEKRTLEFADLIGQALKQNGGAGMSEDRLIAIATEAAARAVATMLASPAPKQNERSK